MTPEERAAQSDAGRFLPLAQRIVARYLDTFAQGAEAWQQSEYLLDAINEWRGRNRDH